MKSKRTPFTGNWIITALEFNIAGEWYEEFAPEPGSWELCFSEQGFFGQRTSNPIGIIRGNWNLDEKGIITILYKSNSLDRCVFRQEGCATYLYMYDDAQHIIPDPAVIVKHHTYSRYRLERVGTATSAATPTAS